MKKITILSLALCLCLLAACATPSTDPQNTRVITDALGRQVEIPEKVESIVCVGVGALRYTCYMGAADLATGVEDCEKEAVLSRLYNYVNIEKFKDLPIIGTNGQPYPEAIVQVSPDVIVMSIYASVDADQLQAQTGTPVVVIPGSDTTLDDDAYETIRILGELTASKAGQLSLPLTCRASKRIWMPAPRTFPTVKSPLFMWAAFPSRDITVLRVQRPVMAPWR